MRIETEWQKLTGHLSAQEREDGRRCFYAGALLVVSFFAKRGRLSAVDVADLTSQIEPVLRYRDENESQEPMGGHRE